MTQAQHETHASRLSRSKGSASLVLLAAQLFTACLFTACLLTAGVSFSQGGEYDPLSVLPGDAVETVDLVVRDAKRDREIPLRIYLPSQPKAAPVLLFSHGLGGSREGNTYLGEHWAGRGYVVVFLQHLGSDTAVWQDTPPRELRAAMQAAMTPENLELRIGDVSATLDQLSIWHRAEGHALQGRLDLDRIGMSGHSFGAKTTQVVSGQLLPEHESAPPLRAHANRRTDDRIDAALAMSPSVPRSGRPEVLLSQVKIPWLLMTGTRDAVGTLPKSRLEVFRALPEGEKYELVFDDGDHMAFSDHRLRRRAKKRNPNHHPAILALSTAFWDAYVRSDPKARAWLDGAGPRSVLEPKDSWRSK